MSRQVVLYGIGVSTLLAVALVSNLLLLQAPRNRVQASGETAAPRTTIAPTPPRASAKAPAPAARAPVVLNAGTRVDLVRAVQRELDALGYAPGPVDGRETEVTRAAIMAYEYDNGLPLSAEASSDLLQALLFGVPPVATGVAAPGAGQPATREARETMAAVRTALARKGHLSGGAGNSGTAPSESAIRGYERDNGLPETGRISGRLMAHLMGQTAAGTVLVGKVAAGE